MASGTVLLVEDDATTAQTVRLYLERAGFAVEAVADGAQALAAFRRVSPTLVVLDGMLPGRDGLDLCRAIRSGSTVPIVMLTARTTEEDVLRGLSLGADDYVKKPFSPRELVARLEAILRRSAKATRLSSGALVVDLERHEARLAGDVIPLTPAEFLVLTALLRRPARVYRREELLAQFAGDGEAGPRTVDMHIVNLRRKIGSGSDRPRIETVYGVGYRLTGPVE